MPHPLRVLIVDDVEDERVLATRALSREFEPLHLISVGGPEVLATAIEQGGFDVVITDFRLRWTTGLDVLQAIGARYPDVPVIMFTDSGSEEIAVEAMKRGLFDYIIKKPGNYVRLPIAVQAALRAVETRRELERHRKAQVEHEAELQRLLEREREARAEAERASTLRDEFLATVSHELRTPLTAVLAWTKLLLSRDVEAELRRGLLIIQRNAMLQHRLVEDLLDLSAIISGRPALELRQIDLDALVESAIGAARAELEAKGLRIEFRPSGSPLMICGDPVRLSQVLGNVLGNAMKFTPEGGQIWVRIDKQEGLARIIVQDNGEGIAPEFLPHVFDRFRQQDSSVTRRHGGLGIGLALVKHLVEVHGGTVRAESPGPDKGATFTVCLPLAK